MIGHAFPVLRHTDFARLWAGSTISALGSSLTFIALPLLAWEMTGKASAFAATFVAAGIAMIIAGLFGGAFADRHDRRSMMIVGDAIELLLVVVLVGVVIGDTWSPIPIVAFLIQLVSSTFGSALAALQHDLLPDEHRQSGNALFQFGFQACNLVGPLAGALIFQHAGMFPILAIDAGSYAASIVLVWGIGRDSRATRPARTNGARASSVIREVGEGFARIRSDRALSLLFWKTVALSVGNGALFVGLMPWIVRDLGASPAVFGAFCTMLGTSGVVTAAIFARMGDRLSPARMLGIAVLPMLAGAAIAPYPSVVALLACGLLFGLVDVPLMVAARTITQQRVPSGVQGRVAGAQLLAFQLPRTIGMVAFAPIADARGGHALIVIWSCGIVLAAGVQLVLIRALRNPAGRALEGATGGTH